MKITLGKGSLFPVYYKNFLILFAKENYEIFSLILILLSIFYMFGVGKHLTALLLFSNVETFNLLCPYLINGGDNFLKFVILYLSFADSYSYFCFNSLRIDNNNIRRLSNMMSNLVVYTTLMHLCLIYFKSGVEKLHSDSWYNGIALYYIFNLERFSGTDYNKLLSNNGLIVNIGTYAVVLWELFFPVLVWSKSAKVPVILFGIFMHIGIAITMMLYDFQLLFIVVLGLFFSDQEWQMFYNKIKPVKIYVSERFH
jgi:hypothetical protein